MAEQGNIYARTREQAMKDHAERLSGNSAGIVLVLFTEPIAAVARATGFCNSGYLAAVFKKAFGCTPRAFRRSRGA